MIKKVLILIIFLILIIGCKPTIETVEVGGAEKMADILLIIAQKDFQQIEYKDTRAELEKAGLKVKVASITTDIAVGKDGSKVKPDLAVEDANASDYKAIAVIGGPGAPELGEHDAVLDLLRDAQAKGKVVAAICIAPVVLAKAGVLEGKNATVWNSPLDKSGIDDIESAGATFVDKPVVVDGKLITGNGPAAAKEFGKAIAAALKK